MREHHDNHGQHHPPPPDDTVREGHEGHRPLPEQDQHPETHSAHAHAAEIPSPLAGEGEGGGAAHTAAPATHSNHGAHAAEIPSLGAREGDRAKPTHGPHAIHGEHEAHDRHAGHDPEAFRRRFWLSLLLTIPVIAFSGMVQDWLGYSLAWVPGDEFVAPVLGTAVFLYGGPVFLKGGRQELRWRQPGMMLLISLAISVAFLASVASEAGLVDLEFWWELAALITVMLLGHWQEMRALGLTRGALAALAELLPDEAERIEDGEPRRVPIADLRPGDVVLVRPGARVPADGTVVEGQADFDESMLTGESRPVLRGAGSRTAAGTVALGSAVHVRVDAVGDETAIAGIQRLVAEAQASRSRAQAIADRAAAALFYVAISVGLVTFIVWSLLGDPEESIVRTVTVLVIACPHALGLAIPLVIAISTEVSARHGILIKDRLALERMRNVDVVLFDKTGTLTEGSPVVTAVWSADGEERTALRLAAAVEANSEHPLAAAIVNRASALLSPLAAEGAFVIPSRLAREGASVVPSPLAGEGASVIPSPLAGEGEGGGDRARFPRATDFTAPAGRGVRATVEGVTVEVGGPRLLEERGIDINASRLPSEQLDAWLERGATVLYLLRDGVLTGAFALEDRVREESRRAIADLHEAGVRVAMITGDARNVAEAVAHDLAIDEVFAEVLPEHKAEQVVALQRRGHRVAMVGDGVNDAPALAQADVGIAIGAGTDVAIESAGVVLASDDPQAVLGVIELSRASYRKMVQNLIWATGYNVVAIPLAAGVLAFAGVVFPPALAAVFMSASTVIVAANALLLRRLDLSPQRRESPQPTLRHARA